MPSTADFLMERLENAGIKVVFGIPGVDSIEFYDKLWNNPKISMINTTDEAHAGFAADAYARVNGIGCVFVSYNVGGLKLVNPIACAYEERSPVIVISGSPSIRPTVHSLKCQKDIFEKITCASIVLDNPMTAAYQIDKALESLRLHKQPIYIELPMDMVGKPINYDVYKLGTPKAPRSDAYSLKEALAETEAWIAEAKKPVIIAGVELARYNLAEKMIKFAERNNIPVVTELLSKSVINECHPLFAGMYSGASSLDYPRQLVEESDCVLMFGVIITDATLSFMPMKFQKRQVVACNVDNLKIKSHTYTDVQFLDFCEAVFKFAFTKKAEVSIPRQREVKPFEPRNVKVTTNRMFEKINSILNQNMAIVSDIGDCLWGASDLTVHHSNHFLSPALYGSMGSAIPGAIGVQLAKPHIRPIVIVGDGAFQMSVTELSTIIDKNLNPIIFVLNNRGFVTERMFKEGGYTSIRNWQYHLIGEVFGGGAGMLVQTELELEQAVKTALDSKSVFVINVLVDKKDVSDGMKRMIQSQRQQ